MAALTSREMLSTPTLFCCAMDGDGCILRRPCVSHAFAGKLAKEFYSIEKIAEIKELDSFCDRNFYIRGKPKPKTEPYLTKADQPVTVLDDREYVLKILNSDDSKHGDLVDAENEAMRYLRGGDFPCALVYPVSGSSETKLYARVPLARDLDDEIDEDENRRMEKTEECIVRLVSFLPGETAESLGRISQENLFCIGQFVGRLSRAFQGFESPVLTQKFDRWSLENFLSLEEYITFVNDREIQSIIHRVMGIFKTQVIPKLSHLRRGIIHNDVTTANLLVDTTQGSLKISGLIDFGDIRHSCVVFELANALASFINEDQMLVDSGYLVAGYQAACPIPGLEFDLLYDVVLARLCQVVIITNKEQIKHPDNRYLNHTLEKYSANLTAWFKTSKDEVLKCWRKIGLKKAGNFLMQ